MSVHPGWGGQAFIPASLDRLRRLRELVGTEASMEVDGGVDDRTASSCVEAGASLLVAARRSSGAPDRAEAYAALVSASGAR